MHNELDLESTNDWDPMVSKIQKRGREMIKQT